jgi:hypothetical protein
MAIKCAKEYTNLFQSKGPPKFTQIGIFGSKTNHLATPVAAAGKRYLNHLTKVVRAIHRHQPFKAVEPISGKGISISAK